MIKFKFKCTDNAHKRKYMDEIHQSLVGTPAYIDSQIFIHDNANEWDDAFEVIVGNDAKEGFDDQVFSLSISDSGEVHGKLSTMEVK